MLVDLARFFAFGDKKVSSQTSGSSAYVECPVIVPRSWVGSIRSCARRGVAFGGLPEVGTLSVDSKRSCSHSIGPLLAKEKRKKKTCTVAKQLAECGLCPRTRWGMDRKAEMPRHNVNQHNRKTPSLQSVAGAAGQ